MGKLALTVLVAFGLLAPAAQAAPPGNDDRGSAQALSVPSTVRGTTVDATTEPNEPFACTGAPADSVWYSIAPSAARDLVLELDASGDLDAVVDVFRRDRSQLSSLACGQTNRRGRLTLDFSQPRNAPLLVRVAQRENSTERHVLAARRRARRAGAPARSRAQGRGRVGQRRPHRQPRRRLRRQDVRRALLPRARRLARSLRRGVAVPARHVLVLRRLAGAQLRLRRVLPLHAGGREGGRYSIQVRAPRSRRGALPYHLQVARAGEDDTAPGLVLPNDVRVRGALRGSGADVVDLYRFDVRRPSILDLRLQGGLGQSVQPAARRRGRAPDLVRLRRRGQPADPPQAQAGPLLHGRALALRGQRPLHAARASRARSRRRACW